MKKFNLLLALSLATVTAFAQKNDTNGPVGLRSSTDYSAGTSDSRNTGFGIKGGFNLSDVYGDDKKNFANGSNYKSFHAGIYGQYGFNNRLSIQPELLYSRQGFEGNSVKTTGTGTGATTTTVNERRLDYLNVPVLLVFNILDNVSIHAGPQVSLLTKVTEDGNERKIADENNTYGYSYTSFDYGLAVGAEARVGPARVGARYNAGFNEIIKDQNLATTGNKALSDIKNSNFQVYVGIGFTQ
ncbi:porin family protein [Hymenobacter cellulosilyticus]|uniref:PorT family protein n=1 Tax=Hymenobacter cellulosilyticus TaxID=2932248 RepID=A0A8T9Q7A4_9BACT|nr:porin family protein [Hymenobacter cellulosilyticus]UOQ72822.1 PorT family protein [Hymenobacter cellulosilyticus]